MPLCFDFNQMQLKDKNHALNQGRSKLSTTLSTINVCNLAAKKLPMGIFKIKAE